MTSIIYQMIITPSKRTGCPAGCPAGLEKLGKGSFAEIKLEKGVILGFSGLEKLELLFLKVQI